MSFRENITSVLDLKSEISVIELKKILNSVYNVKTIKDLIHIIHSCTLLTSKNKIFEYFYFEISTCFYHVYAHNEFYHIGWEEFDKKDIDLFLHTFHYFKNEPHFSRNIVKEIDVNIARLTVVKNKP